VIVKETLSLLNPNEKSFHYA